MLTTWFMPAPNLLSESRMRSKVVRTSCSNVTLPLSGDNGTPLWPETKIQQPACVSMRSASLKLGAIGLGRCLSKSMALLPVILPVGVCTGFNRRRLSLPSTASDPVFYVNRDGPAGIVERLSILDRDGRVRRPPQTLTGLFNHLRRDIGGQHRSTWADGIKRRLGGDARPTRHIKYAMTGCKPRRTKHEWKEMGRYMGKSAVVFSSGLRPESKVVNHRPSSHSS